MNRKWLTLGLLIAVILGLYGATILRVGHLL